MGRGWIGVDLDGTLAHYDEWRGIGHIGEPIKPMVARVKRWTAAGKTVKVFTARVSGDPEEADRARAVIMRWLWDNDLGSLEIVCCKDFHMTELWDDRCVQVIPNEGRPVARWAVNEP